MRKTAVIAFLGFAVVLASAAEGQIYRWVDEDGVVHYSDTPHPGAEEVVISEGPSAPTDGSSYGTAQRTLPTNGDREDSEAFDYESLTIASPAAEETLWNIEGQLTVRLNLQPALRSGDRVRLYFDGEPRTMDGMTVQLQEVYRGTHTLQAEVVDESGQLMIRSDPTRFYVHQTSIANPN